MRPRETRAPAPATRPSGPGPGASSPAACTATRTRPLCPRRFPSSWSAAGAAGCGTWTGASTWTSTFAKNGTDATTLAVSVARRHPDVTCVEVDAPATAEPKRAGIQGGGLACPNHTVLAADLAKKPLEVLLGAAGWRADVRSVVVAEGLLMYLAPAQVSTFFAQVRACTSPGSRLAFSSMDSDEEGRPRPLFAGSLLGRAIRSSLRLVGEPLRWGIAPSAVGPFLTTAGYRVLDQPTPRMLRERFLTPHGLAEEPLAPYEHLVLAEVRDSVG